MKDMDQIAEEAAHVLCGNVIHKKDKEWAIGIIKSAIEKAAMQLERETERAYENGFRAGSAAARSAIERVIQAR